MSHVCRLRGPSEGAVSPGYSRSGRLAGAADIAADPASETAGSCRRGSCSLGRASARDEPADQDRGRQTHDDGCRKKNDFPSLGHSHDVSQLAFVLAPVTFGHLLLVYARWLRSEEPRVGKEFVSKGRT